MVAGLTLDKATHTYTINGCVIPSVTQILQAKGLGDFSMVDPSVLAYAAERGTAVHLAAQYLDEDRLDESKLDAEVGGYLDGYKRFLRDARFTPGRIEARVYSAQYKYAGTFDRNGILGQSLCCLDIKTGALTDAHRPQLAAYTMAMVMPRRFRRIALQLTRKGEYRIHEFSIGDLPRDFGIFLDALQEWRRQQQPNKEGKTA